MPVILHKLRDHQVDRQTEILILGTFSADIPGSPDFFYGRTRSFLWHLLPQSWGLEPLKEATLESKQEFMTSHKIDFVDIIQALDVPEGKEADVDDTFIDSHILEWKDINSLIDKLPKLKAVYFTRKTFNGISNMRVQVNIIAKYCKEKDIRFCKLETPSRFYSPDKQQQWIDTIVLQSTCLRP